MELATIGNFQIMPFGGNPMQNLGAVALTAFAVNAIASLPMATAREVPNIEKEACEVLCSPLPGGKEDEAEKVCNEICIKDGVITKMKEWTINSAGKVIETVAPAIEPASEGFDCLTLCSGDGIGSGLKSLAGIGIDLWLGTAVNPQKLANRAFCPIISLGNVPACLACCGLGKYTGNI